MRRRFQTTLDHEPRKGVEELRWLERLASLWYRKNRRSLIRQHISVRASEISCRRAGVPAAPDSECCRAASRAWVGYLLLRRKKRSRGAVNLESVRRPAQIPSCYRSASVCVHDVHDKRCP